MTKEWNNPFNPFNSFKVLLWRKHLEACARDDYLTPVTVDVDPSNRCNYRCIWCNAWDIIRKEEKDLPTQHLLNLADFLRDWGRNTPEGNPKSACVAGGGEPLMHSGTMAFLERMYDNGLQNGLITNGSLLDDKKIDIIAKTCRWVGFSMDSATPETYSAVKFGVDNSRNTLFNKVCENIKKLTKKIDELGVLNDVAYKFLLHPLNANEIYQAVKLAKSLGIRDFHLRPVGYLNLTKTKGKELTYTPEMIVNIDKQIEEALKLEDKNFRVYGVRHKFNPDLSVKKNFSRCWAIPLLPTFGADGNVYMCFDMRGREDTIMCRHYPDVTEIVRFWNSDKHKEMVKSLNINTCPRCFHPETKILTSNGIRNIVDIDIDDKVVSANGNIRKVKRKYVNKFDGKLLSISYLSDNRSVLVTPNHKIYVIEKKKCSFVGRKTTCFGKPCSITRINADICKHPGCMNPSQHYTISKIEAGNLTTNHMLVIPKYKKCEVNEFTDIKSDLAWLLGLYVAEGHCSKKLKRDYSIKFYLSSSETEIAKRVENIIYKYYRVKSQKWYIRNNALTINFHSKTLRDLCIKFGNRAYEKTIPLNVISGMSIECLESFLIGYYDGDGCYNDAVVTATTVSENLVSRLKLLCSKLDIFMSSSRMKMREVIIYGRKVCYKHTPYSIRILSKARLQRLLDGKINLKRHVKSYYYETSGYFAVPVKNIEEVDYVGNVHNLEVERDHNYLINGIAVENCTFTAYNEMIEQVIIKDGMCINFP